MSGLEFARGWRRPVLIATTLAAIAAVILDAGRQENPFLGDVERLLALVSATCALLGCWLVLRHMAMMSDAIAHAILFGIVAMLFLTSRLGMAVELSSPIFVFGAAGAGLLTVFLTESILRTGLVREDAAIGMVFAFLFALALVWIAASFGDAHVDEHLVLAGGVENTVFRRLTIESWTLPAWLAASLGGAIQSLAPVEAVRVTAAGEMTILRWDMGPRALWTMGLAALVSSGFVGLLWKELKLTTFDAGLAASLGFAPAWVNYSLMGLVSVTAVGAFEAVGSIIVIALFVAPPAAAYLLTEDLFEMQLLSLLLAIAAAIGGFHLGLALNANFGGSVAVCAGGIFVLTFLAAPRQGLLAQWRRRRRQARSFALDTLLVHLAQHEGQPEEAREASLANLPAHLRWSARRCDRVAARARRRGLLREAGGRLHLTAAGRERAGRVLAQGASRG